MERSTLERSSGKDFINCCLRWPQEGVEFAPSSVSSCVASNMQVETAVCLHLCFYRVLYHRDPKALYILTPQFSVVTVGRLKLKQCAGRNLGIGLQSLLFHLSSGIVMKKVQKNRQSLKTTG